MKVKELIKELMALDPELEVFVSGYEGGFERVTNVSEPKDFILDFYTDWYYGPHEVVEDTNAFDIDDKEYKTTRGVIL